MKVLTSTLIDKALDWAVAKAQGRTPTLNMNSHGMVWHGWWLATGGEYERMPSYSNDWAQGGPIIERERIQLEPAFDKWRAVLDWLDEPYGEGFGPTPLIAAMRCYVASKLGDEVDIPEELVRRLLTR